MADEAKPEAGSKRFEQLERNHQELLGYLKKAEERSVKNRRLVIGLVFFGGVLWVASSFFETYAAGQRRAAAERQKMADDFIKFRDGLRQP